MFKMKLESGFDPTVPCKKQSHGSRCTSSNLEKERKHNETTNQCAPLIFGANAQQTPKKAAKR
jgi:hypothetical protein